MGQYSSHRFYNVYLYVLFCLFVSFVLYHLSLHKHGQEVCALVLGQLCCQGLYFVEGSLEARWSQGRDHSKRACETDLEDPSV